MHERYTERIYPYKALANARSTNDQPLFTPSFLATPMGIGTSLHGQNHSALLTLTRLHSMLAFESVYLSSVS